MNVLFDNGSSTCEGNSDQSCTIGSTINKKTKPIEVYAFVDPICPASWGMEPNLKKLIVEYGQYFTIRVIIGKSCDCPENPSQWNKNAQLSRMPYNEKQKFKMSSYKASLAIKAAELQGKARGNRFMRILRESLFADRKDISTEDVIIECAKRAKLDLNEFEKDLNSERPIKALQCDRRITSEMGVEELPTLVFFNICDETEGVKVTGCYPYSVYVQILTETLGKQPEKQVPPSLEKFLEQHRCVATQELATVYDKEKQDILRDLKKLTLKQLIKPIHVKYGTYWKYIGDKK
ncbi:DsbA family protein [Pullulanibacillus pueri]|uniref:DsbA family protein n=1 Tax=Pullulanibacillus pueri TaxID=1437324 RepID=UPI001666D40C|nr:DsbA family protein [Pullulanibacillus pueri]